MTAYKDRSREELLQEKELLEAKFQEIKGKGLKLDMSRGKPCLLYTSYYPAYYEVPEEITEWGKIPVPSNWQMEGFEPPYYTCLLYTSWQPSWQ